MGVGKDIADYLATKAVGTVGSTLFYAIIPDGPNVGDAIVSVLPEQGSTSDMWMEWPRIQIVVRNGTLSTAETKIKEIENIFYDNQNMTINGTKYLHVLPMGTSWIDPVMSSERRWVLRQTYQVVKSR